MTSHEIPDTDRLGRVEVRIEDLTLVYTGGGYVYAHSDAFAFCGKRYRASVNVRLSDGAASPNAPATVESTTGGQVARSRRDAVTSRVISTVMEHATSHPGYPLAAEAASAAQEVAAAEGGAAAALDALRAAERALQVARRDARRATWALEKFRRDGAASRS